MAIALLRSTQPGINYPRPVGSQIAISLQTAVEHTPFRWAIESFDPGAALTSIDSKLANVKNYQPTAILRDL
jgi:hypothetical protein